MWREAPRRPETHHGPHGTLTSPVDDLVHSAEGILYAVAGRLEAELVRASLGERERVVGLGRGDARVDDGRCPLLGGRGGHGSRGASGRGGDGAGEGQGTSLTQRRRESCWAASTSQLPVMHCEKHSMHLSESTAWLPGGSRGVDQERGRRRAGRRQSARRLRCDWRINIALLHHLWAAVRPNPDLPKLATNIYRWSLNRSEALRLRCRHRLPFDESGSSSRREHGTAVARSGYCRRTFEQSDASSEAAPPRSLKPTCCHRILQYDTE